jgi:hypothetical protein
MSVRTMTLEEYPPYKALVLPVGLFGPAPFCPTECICGHFSSVDGCVCVIGSSKRTWALEHPTEFAAEQKEQRIWMRRWKYWNDQETDYDEKLWKLTKPIEREFERLKDQESPIGCDWCERNGSTSCTCRCYQCSSKYCTGECHDDAEYL